MTPRAAMRRRATWSVPVATAAVVTLAAVLPGTASAAAHPTLPARTAAELLAAVQTSAVTALSGTVVETARLGLPTLPGAGDTAALSPQTLISGTHTARVWVDGADKQRIALLGQLSEADAVHNGNDLWTYTSSTQQVGHTTVGSAAASAKKDTAGEKGDLTKYTPLGAAQQALAAIDPSTAVTVDRTARVAGHSAYTLVLTPRDNRSTVRRIAIAIDATRSVPLRVQVFGAAKAAAFEIGFTHVSFARPSASTFQFTPPAGSKVSSDLLGATAPRSADGATTSAGSTGSPKVLGTGWTSVLELPASKDGSSPVSALTGGSHRAGEVVAKLFTTLPNGDQLLRSALLNVLVTQDGRTFVGAVTPEVLEQTAAGHAG
ncbi:MAG: hypothetical protein JWL79_3553 [Frankiales bacterium]|nr:hypothetical protein [Frankiales bacterium]